MNNFPAETQNQSGEYKVSFADIVDYKKLGINRQIASRGIDLHLAAATLMYDVIISDNHVDHMELANMIDILKRKYSLSTTEITELVTIARVITTNEHSMEQFAKQLKDTLSEAERNNLLDDFWSLASADMIIKTQERSIIARIGRYLDLDENTISSACARAETKLELNIA